MVVVGGLYGVHVLVLWLCGPGGGEVGKGVQTGLDVREGGWTGPLPHLTMFGAKCRKENFVLFGGTNFALPFPKTPEKTLTKNRQIALPDFPPI